jgi:hypothetical protein
MSRGLTTFVGRERELEVLERALEDARSQLLYEFRQRIGKDRAFILSGSCSPDGGQTPFLPFIEVMRGANELSNMRKQLVKLNWRYQLILTEPAFGILAVLNGRLGKGVRIIESVIMTARRDGWRVAEDWAKMFLCAVYLEIMFPKEKPPLSLLLKNIPMLIKILFVGRSSIESLVSQVRSNPQFDPNGFHIGRAEMILGLLYKGKRKRAIALEHLTEARRILSQFGRTPMLARVDAALAELR